MSMTPITYLEASRKLSCPYKTVAMAAQNGVFTKIPVVGHEQRIALEQVELFVGKKQLRRTLLSKEEKETWRNIEATILDKQQVNDQPVTVSSASTPVATSTYPSVSFPPPDKTALEWMQSSGIGYKVTDPDKREWIFQPALAGRNQDEREEGQGGNGLFFILVVLGLVWLFSQENKAKEEAPRWARGRTTKQKELERENLVTSQREEAQAILKPLGLTPEVVETDHSKSYETFREHPEAARKLWDITIESGYKSPLLAVAS